MRATTDGHSANHPIRATGLEGRRVHLVGIGGAGMSGAASMLVTLGARVSGSDITPFPGLGELVQRGVRVNIGHSAALLDRGIEQLIVSAAIPENNPELAGARQRGIPVLPYAALLGIFSRSFETVAVAGTHGKSTTTALTAHILRSAGLDPSYIVGARSSQLGGSSRVGTGQHFVVESCEFNRSFLELHPTSAAILNVEADHLDCYDGFDGVVAAFRAFARLVAPDGLIVCNADDRWSLAATQASPARVECFGFTPSADWRGVNLSADCGRFAFDVTYRGATVLSSRLSIPGRYNVSNALAAISLAYHAGADPDAIAGAVATFSGVDRRLTWRGHGCGVTIVDDYAHHPTEIRAALEAARDRYRPKRMWVVFQPHQCARTRDFMEAFAGSFAQADEVIINDIYGAREADADACRCGARELADRVRRNGRHASYLPTLDTITAHLLERCDEGDVVLTMGAGDIWKVADELVARICESHDARRAVGV